VVSKRRFSQTKIPDGSGGIPMCGSCIERFDTRSIFNKLARLSNSLKYPSKADSKGLLLTVAGSVEIVLIKDCIGVA